MTGPQGCLNSHESEGEEMANVCSDYNVKGCPASYYLNCPAYLSNVNCWEVSKRPCCDKHSRSACMNCPVYHAGLAKLKAETANTQPK